MADNSVRLDFFANAAAAEKAIVGLEKKFDDLQNKLKQVSRQSKTGADDGASAWKSIGASIASVAAGYVALPALIGAVVSAQQKLRADSEETATAYDRMFKRFRVQAGLSGLAGDTAKKQILDVAQRVGVPEQFASAAATQLVSSGFSVEESTGGALDTLLKTLAASNQTEGDPTEIAKAAGQFLASQGKDKTAANLKEVLVAGQRLYKATDMQLVDLGQLASKASSLAGKMSVPEILGAFDVVRNVKNADTASTGLKIFTERLTGAAGDPTREKTLRSLKLKAADVDFVGENLATVLDRLGGAFDKVKPEQRAGLMQRLFGTEGADSADVLIRDRAKIGDAIKVAADRAGFDRDVAEATSGRASALQRLKVEQNRFADRDLAGDDVFREALRSEAMASGMGRLRAALSVKEYDLARGVGLSQDTSAWLSFGATGEEIARARQRAGSFQGDSDAQTKLLEETNATLKEIAKNTRSAPNRNAQRE